MLLAERSVSRGDFVLASGKRSSYYIDARRTTMSAEGLAVVGHLGLGLLDQRGWKPQVVGGLTLGADPVACAIAVAGAWQGRAINAFTVRKEAKDHGTARRIEGCFLPGATVVIVEDVITTGGSARQAIEAVQSEGGRVLGVLAVVDREEGGREALEGAGFPVATMTTATDLGLRK
jgi:orotate phosphoribosyltransferase